MLNPGIKGSASVAVTAANTAAAMGSGELNVFATPALAALVEKACWQSIWQILALVFNKAEETEWNLIIIQCC